MRVTRTCLGSIKLAMDAYFNHLNGVFCIYKPMGFSMKNSVQLIKQQLLKDLNELPAYDHEIENYYKEEDRFPPISGGSSVPVTTTIPGTVTDYSKHRLVLGEMFVSDNLKVRYLDGHDIHGSGVVVCGVGMEGRNYLEMIRMAKYLRVYHVKGRLGYATNNHYTHGHFIERSTFRHVNKGKMDKVCSGTQSGHQRLMFQCAGVDPHSQEAYELASQGLVRPADNNNVPILYGVKCIDFTPPDFTLEVHAINENNNYLAQLVNDIGLHLKTNAVCTHIHRIRYGVFGLDHTLLKKDWNLPEIARNIRICDRLLTPENLFTNIQITSKDNESSVDLLSERVTDDQGPSQEDILREQALKQLSKLREELLAKATDRSAAIENEKETLHWNKKPRRNKIY